MSIGKDKTFYLFVLGCQMNRSDGERIEHLLKKAGYQAVREAEAGLIIVLACSVRQKPIDRIWGKLKLWQKINPQASLILTGCLTERDYQSFRERFDYLFDIEDLTKFAQRLGLKPEPGDYLDLPAEYRDRDQALVPIMTGCNNFCSYCVVPYTRGRERSRPKEKILAEIRSLIEKGYQEILLLGQNVNSYQDQESDFVDLLKAIDKIPGRFKIRFLTSHPKDLSDGLIKAIVDLDKLSDHLHLPVQSGDDLILKKMNRGYTVADYLNLVKRLRSKIKNLSLTTDIIVGFPGESREAFQNTIDLVKEARFDQAFISQYSPRPGTLAEKLNDSVSSQEKKRRWQILNKMIN